MKKVLLILSCCSILGACAVSQTADSERQAILSLEQIEREITVSHERLPADEGRIQASLRD